MLWVKVFGYVFTVAFDKVARSLRIPWHPTLGPGAALELAAKKAEDPYKYELPVPLSNFEWKHKLGFSFAGIKSSVARLVEKELNGDDRATVCNIAASFQRSISQHLIDKLYLGIKECQKQGLSIKTLVVSGGVASNAEIKSR